MYAEMERLNGLVCEKVETLLKSTNVPILLSHKVKRLENEGSKSLASLYRVIFEFYNENYPSDIPVTNTDEELSMRDTALLWGYIYIMNERNNPKRTDCLYVAVQPYNT